MVKKGQPKKCRICNYEFEIGDNYILHMLETDKAHRNTLFHYVYYYGIPFKDKQEIERILFELEEE